MGKAWSRFTGVVVNQGGLLDAMWLWYRLVYANCSHFLPDWVINTFLPLVSIIQMHVTNGTLLPTESGYVTSPPPPSDEAYAPQVYGLDCEMVYTTLGLQLARITIVNMREETVFESLVKPSHVIVDYNTRYISQLSLLIKSEAGSTCSCSCC